MVAISTTRIANMALSHLGARHTIESLIEVTTEAEAAELWYEFSLLQTLESHDWGFARRRVVLTTHSEAIPTTSNTPLAGVWAFKYVYPENCVAVRKIQNPLAPPLDAVPFEIELNIDGNEKVILTNMENAVAVYTFDQQEPSLYSAGFVLALSYALAANMAFSITGKVSLEKVMFQKFFTVVGIAGAENANEGVRPPPRDADWVRARHGVSTVGTGQSWRALPDGSN